MERYQNIAQLSLFLATTNLPSDIFIDEVHTGSVRFCDEDEVRVWIIGGTNVVTTQVKHLHHAMVTQKSEVPNQTEGARQFFLPHYCLHGFKRWKLIAKRKKKI